MYVSWVSAPQGSESPDPGAECHSRGDRGGGGVISGTSNGQLAMRR